MQAGTVIKGRDITVTTHDDAISLKYAVWAHGFKGTKRIPLRSITSVQFRPAGAWTVGFIQLGVLGGIEHRGGLVGAAFDENSVAFNKDWEAEFASLRDWLQSCIERPAGEQSQSADLSGELEKLAALLERGLLTPDEFQAEKTKLLK